MIVVKNPTLMKCIMDVVIMIAKIQWKMVVQEVAIRCLQQNQVGQSKPGLENCKATKQKQEGAEYSSSVTR